MINVDKKIKKPSLWYSFLILFVVLAIIMAGILIFDAEIEFMLLIAIMAIIPLIQRLGFSYKQVEKSMFSMMYKALGPVVIVLVVGALIGSWLISGTVPTLIYYGIQTISPAYFLVTALIFSTVVSVSTGTSWGTLGTAGLALMGISHSLGLPPGMSAGAIISGAYFGDKMSPLSDTTNLAPAVVGGDLIEHIKHMLWTTTPAYILTAIVFLILGLFYGKDNADLTKVSVMTDFLSEQYKIGLITLTPLAAVLLLLIFKKPPITSIFIGAVLGGLVAIFYQGKSLTETINTIYDGYEIESGMEVMDELLNQGGVTSMYHLAGLFLFALGLGGILYGSGVLTTMLENFFNRIKSVRSLIPTSVLTSYIATAIAGSSSAAIAITGTMLKPLFDKFQLEPKNLSRLMEDTATQGAVCIPWNGNALIAAASLGVNPLTFLPFCFLAFFTPVFTLIYGYTGFTMTKVSEEELDRDKAKEA